MTGPLFSIFSQERLTDIIRSLILLKGSHIDLAFEERSSAWGSFFGKRQPSQTEAELDRLHEPASLVPLN